MNDERFKAVCYAIQDGVRAALDGALNPIGAQADYLPLDAIQESIQKGVDDAFPYFDAEAAVREGVREAFRNAADLEGLSLHDAISSGVSAGIVEAAKLGYLVLDGGR